MQKQVEWTYNGEYITDKDDMPKDTIGFIYKITNLTNGRVYYGRKGILMNTKKRLSKKEKEKTKSRKTFKRTTKESAWRKYTGSNKQLNFDLKENRHNYKKEILHFCTSKAQMTYFETKAIVCSDCMLDDDCYNDWFSARVYKKNLLTHEIRAKTMTL